MRRTTKDVVIGDLGQRLAISVICQLKKLALFAVGGGPHLKTNNTFCTYIYKNDILVRSCGIRFYSPFCPWGLTAITKLPWIKGLVKLLPIYNLVGCTLFSIIPLILKKFIKSYHKTIMVVGIGWGYWWVNQYVQPCSNHTLWFGVWSQTMPNLQKLYTMVDEG